MPCKLCGRDLPLIKSHIVPEFMYRYMKDEKGRFYGLGKAGKRPVEYFQKGLREPLLCWDCEQQFSRYEQYASQVMYHNANLKVTRQNDLLYFSQLEYKPFKLFQLSLLWRYGVTSIDYLKGLQLVEHEPLIRQMLLDDDPGEPCDYPCIVGGLMLKGKQMKDLITGPYMTDLNGHRVWSFVAAGFIFTFHVSSHTKPQVVVDNAISREGKMMVHARKIQDIPYVCQDFIATLLEAERRWEEKRKRSK